MVSVKKLRRPRSPRKRPGHGQLEDNDTKAPAAAAAQPGLPHHLPVAHPVPGNGPFTGGGGAWDIAGPSTWDGAGPSSWDGAGASGAASSSEVAGDLPGVPAAPGGLHQQMVSKCMLMNIRLYHFDSLF